jgi:hypothetical protein
VETNVFFQGGTTLIDPITLGFTLALGIALLAVPRRWVFLPLCLTLCFVPMQQRIVVAGLDFDMGRIMLLFGWTRILARGERAPLRATPLDWCFLTWLVVGTLFYFLAVRTSGALIYRAGIMLDALGMFFLCRFVVRSATDVAGIVQILCWIALAIAPFMVFESITGFNVFSVLGGVEPYSIVREGRVRAQGSLAHPILAGTFGATLFPLAFSLWWARPDRRLAAGAGMAGSLAAVYFAASSGPLIALGLAVVGWALWPVRAWLSWVRWGVVAALTVIHFIREAPVWHLIGRVSDLIGGTGWHRYALIDAFINNWRDWILVGIGTRSTRMWGWGLEDVTNQFVAEGVRGGLATLLAFIAMLVAAFAAIGRTLARVRRARGVPAARRRASAFVAWGLGTALTAHCASWISVSYFGEMWMFLYLHMAMIAVVSTDPALVARRAPAAPAAAAPPAPPAIPVPAVASGAAEAPALGRSLLGRHRVRTALPSGPDGAAE